ncbi:hypothetical protein MNBD_GAMMA09-3131 [hydrothermal vent metagenome]|uniref:Uncharacterized protein n=1 Tax=hydrothermal vent metagenome TaxID=652676 RepID=A0A3B0XUT0_9ZZZZ
MLLSERISRCHGSTFSILKAFGMLFLREQLFKVNDNKKNIKNNFIKLILS